MTPKRSILPLIALAVLAVLPSACRGTKAPITVPAGAQAGNLVELEPCTYEAGKVEYEADCGTLIAPQNR